MSKGGRHRDKGFAKWWIWLGVVFAVTIGIIYLAPFIFSSQPQEELEARPTSITEVDPTSNNSIQEQSGMKSEQQQSKNVSITEESPSGGAEEAVPRPQ